MQSQSAPTAVAATSTDTVVSMDPDTVAVAIHTDAFVDTATATVDTAATSGK